MNNVCSGAHMSYKQAIMQMLLFYRHETEIRYSFLSFTAVVFVCVSFCFEKSFGMVCFLFLALDKCV